MKMAFVNYKAAQPAVMRELVRKFHVDHGNARRKKTWQSHEKLMASVERTTLEFGRKSTVHCMNRIFQQHSNLYERCFWLLTIALALLGSIYVCIILSNRFKAGNIQTVVQSTDKPLFEIYFPQVVICNKNHLNWDRLEQAKERFMPNETNREKIRLFELVIGLYDKLSFGKFGVFKALEGQPLALVNDINFTLVFDFMTWRCEELLRDCAWRHTSVNCCEVFLKGKSLNGLCWHFNTLSTYESRQKQLSDRKYPLRTGGAGQKSALTLRVSINEHQHYNKDNNKGILVSIMDPKVFHKDAYSVPANSHAVILVDPVVFLYDNSTRSLSASTRRCFFDDERTSYSFKHLANFSYMIENCETQCRQEYLLNYCNCTMDLLFPSAEYKSCKTEDLLCLARNNNYFRFIEQDGEEEYVSRHYEGMICKCFRNCYSLNYLPDVKPLYLPSYLRSNSMFIDLDVQYRFSKIMVYRTSLVFGWVDLLVAFGGIAGLFLGCSLISAIELLYFVAIELPVSVFAKLSASSQAKAVDRRHNKLFPCTQRPHPKPCYCVWNRHISIAQDLRKYDFSLYGNGCDYPPDIAH